MDLDYMHLPVVPLRTQKAMKNQDKFRFRARQARENRKNEKWSDGYTVRSGFDCDEDILQMRKTYCKEFFSRFRMAYRNYEAGAWMVARDMLITCYYDIEHRGTSRSSIESIASTRDSTNFWYSDDCDLPADGPTRALLNFMKQTDFVAPPSWAGYRELTDK